MLTGELLSPVYRHLLHWTEQALNPQHAWMIVNNAPLQHQLHDHRIIMANKKNIVTSHTPNWFIVVEALAQRLRYFFLPCIIMLTYAHMKEVKNCLPSA